MTVVKQFTYRDSPAEEFSNTYWFVDPVPNTTAEWDALRNDLVLKEQQVFDAGVKTVRVYGYDSSEPHHAHVYAHDYGTTPVVGTFVPGVTDVKGAGDQASVLEWDTGQKSTHGKPIFLRKYFHSVHLDGTDLDKLSPTYIAILEFYGGQLVNGGVWGGLASPSPRGGVAQTVKVPEWVTTRTLKRRGKRPPTPARAGLATSAQLPVSA